MDARWILGVALGVSATACTNVAPAVPHAVAAQEDDASDALEVHLTGCDDVALRPLTCVIAEQGAEVRLWVEGSTAPTVRVGAGTGSAPVVEARAEGWLVVAPVRPADGEIAVERAGAPTWTLALRRAEPTPRVDEALAIVTTPGSDRAETVPRALARIEEGLDALAPGERVAAMRLAMKLHFATGNPDAAAEVGARALDLALDEGHVAAAVDIAQLLVHVFIERGDEATWRWLLDLQALYLPQIRDDGRRALRDYYAGSLAQHAGDVREALRAFERAELESRRLGLDDQELSAASLRAGLLGVLGRTDAQRELVARIVELVERRPPAERCTAAASLSNAAWGVLMATPPGTASPQAARLLDVALGLYGDGGSCDVAQRPDHRKYRDDAAVTSALEALWRDDLAVAADRLAQVDAEALAPTQRAWVGYVRAAVEHRAGHETSALDLARDAGAHLEAGTNLDPWLGWRLAMLEGEIQQERGDAGAAVAALQRAEAEAEAAVGRVGLAQGREGLAVGLGRSAIALIEAHLDAGDTGAALEVARRSRGREFRPVGRAGRIAALGADERERWQRHLRTYRETAERLGVELSGAWKLPADERERMRRRHQAERAALREALDAAYDVLAAADRRAPPQLAAPSPGQLRIVFHPGRTGWLGFAADARDVRVQRLGEVDPEASPQVLAQTLLEPFATSIREADVLVALPMKELLVVELAALPFGEGQLVDALPVVYAADLPVRADAMPGEATALVVGDPATRAMGRLPQARREAEAIAARLRDAGVRVTLQVGDAATHEAVTSALDGVGLFHYAGHGRGGADAWELALPLVGEASLGVGDVLAIPRSPRRVVLTGCETGKVDARFGGGGIHLAAAFLLGGSELVVAASEVVPDATAVAFATALYAPPGAGIPGIADAHRAQLALRASDPDHWSAFRTWVP